MDNSTRRAFALDSRTVWVEKELLSNGFFISKDNLPIGPGEYMPTMYNKNRNISTPSLGRKNDHFEDFRSGIRRNDGNQLSQSSLSRRYDKSSLKEKYTIDKNLPIPGQKSFDREDHATIFHESDRRQPLDPKLRFCSTPGPYTIRSELKNDGITQIKSVHFGPSNIPFGDRESVKFALPSYDVQYESTRLSDKPRVQVVKLKTSVDRFPHYTKQNLEKLKLEAKLNNNLIDSMDEASIASSQHDGSVDSSIDMNQYKSIFKPNTPIELNLNKKTETEPIKKKSSNKNKGKQKFDTTCYDKNRKEKPQNLTIQNINKLISYRCFGGTLTAARSYNSKRVESKISDRMKKYNNFANTS
jgi:hypothetical protein